MKIVLFLFLALVAVAYCATGSKTTYTTRYDHLNIDEILYNNRLLRSYYKCIVSQGPCTAEGTELKRVFPDALKTKCRKCTPQQKKNSRKVIEFIMKYRPDMWEGVLKKYDPKGQLTKDILTDPNFLG